MSTRRKITITGEFLKDEESTITLDYNNSVHMFVSFLCDLGLLTQEDDRAFHFEGYQMPQFTPAKYF